MQAMEELYTNYKNAVLGSGAAGATEEYVAQVMASIAEQSLVQLTQPFTFSSYHQRILEPYNFYEFGQRYVRGLVDFNKSLLGHAELFEQIRQQLEAGHNVVMLANHQTEADPAVWALMLEATYPELATDVIYVAGDRVVTDPLCKPFSMGRNLFCVHSKKHLDDYPELKADKMAMNRRTLKAMQQALNEGGKLLWIAPSGGRDRSKDEETGENVPDVFDPSAVELMRALATKAKPEGHLYPMAMYSYKIMPPPATLEKSLGEKRITNHAPVGISVCPELDLDAILEGVEDKEERQAKLAKAAFDQVTLCYKELVQAINNPKARSGAYTQPWLEVGVKPLS